VPSIRLRTPTAVGRESPGASTPALENALSKIDYTKEAANGNEAYFASRVKDVTDAIAAASAK
jgi:hypothetical protein